MKRIREVEDLRMSLISILVVDDMQLWIRFVQTRIDQETNMRIVGVAKDGLEAVRKADELQPHLILLDVDLPKLNGIEAASQIRNVAPKAAILFLSECSDLDVVHAALGAGGRGYLLKSAMSRDLVTAIEAVLQGKPFLSRGLIGQDDWR